MNLKFLTFLFVGLLFFSFPSCNQIENIQGELAEALDLLDGGIDAIGTESQGWRLTLDEIAESWPENLHNSKEEINQLMAEGIGATSSNIICVVDAIPNRIIRGLETIKAKLLNQSKPPIVPTVCQVSMPLIDMNLPDFSRRKIVINGYDFYDGNLLYLTLRSFAGDSMLLEHRLTKQSHYQYTINIAEMDEELKKWDVLTMYFEDELISEWSLIQEENPDRYIIGFIPPEIEGLCPDHIAGDNDFNQNGPHVKLETEIFIVNEKEVWVRIFCHMKETDGSYAEARGEWQGKVWPSVMSPPPSADYKIVSFKSPRFSRANYVDDDKLVDYPTVLGSLVNQYRVMADTSGNDIGECTDDDENSNLKVVFNEVLLDIQEE